MSFDLASIASGLPFATAQPHVLDALAAGALVIAAPPGSGKTTIVPPLIANSLAANDLDGRVVVTAPRRVVVRAAAARLSQLSTRPELVGYTIRGDRQLNPTTRVEFVTPGVLLRRVLADPDLPGIGAVVLDEVHERSLESDLLVGLLAELRQLRPDLPVIAMSATADLQRFATLLGGDSGPATVVRSEVAPHPLTTRYAPPANLPVDARGVRADFLDHVAAEAARAHAEAVAHAPSSDTLVFVPGRREVAHVARRLADLATEATILELHGSVSAAGQSQIVRGRQPGEPPRIVVSTSLAESALTVPGVRVVVDSGLAREPRRDAGRGMHGLITVSASRASADQRAGRAARLSPGVVVRCYDRRRYEAMPEFATPQVATADLTGAVLALLAWGVPAATLTGPQGFALPTALPAKAVADALSTLVGLGAVADAGTLTALGRRLSTLPVDPRLGRALLTGAGSFGTAVAAEVVAAIEEDVPGDDLAILLRDLRAGRHPAAGRWRHQAGRLDRLAGPASELVPGAAVAVTPNQRENDSTATGFVVAAAFPERIARLDGDSYRLASGTRAGLPAGSTLRGERWLAVADLTRARGAAAAGTGAVIRSAAALTEELALAAAPALLTDEVHTWFAEGKVSARRRRRLGAITLAETPVRPDPAAAAGAVAAALRSEGLDLLTWSPGADRLRRRVALLHRVVGPPWPDVSDAGLLADLEQLAPEIDQLAGGGKAHQLDLTATVRRLLPWPTASRLDALVPERLTVPSGNTAAIDYPGVDDPTERPTVKVKLQECFGWAQTPAVVDGQVPIVFHLLSPAGRPVAVTDDLASFWSGPYQQVRAQLRGRYPKHPWPEDPWNALATARANRPRG